MFLLAKCDTIDINQIIIPGKSQTLNGRKYKIGNWDLLLFQEKTNETISHLSIKEKGNGVLIGTPMYKDIAFKNVLKQVLIDFWTNDLEIDRLKGNFIFIFWKNEQVYFLNDKLGVQPVFFDEKNNRYSSSFLLLLQNSQEKFKINRNAFLEKLSTGFIVGSDTLLNGIYRILSNNTQKINENNDIQWIKHKCQDINNISFHENGKSNSINAQINQLGSLF